MNRTSKLFMSVGLLLTAMNGANADDLVYGRVYHLQNGYSGWSGGWLDADGAGCQSNVYCVSTALSFYRADGTGSWVIKSATGKADGTPVHGNDEVYLVNQYGSKTYLDVRGAGCQGNLLCVSTASTSDRDKHSGSWRIIKSDKSTGPIPAASAFPEDPTVSTVRLQNGYDNWKGGYLDVRGGGCQGNHLCVSTSSTYDRDKGSTTWRFWGSGLRKSVAGLSAGELLSLRLGVAKMMSRNNSPRNSADYRRSWIYWANVHSHFGNDCAGAIRPTGPNSGMNGVQLWTATNPDETATWCKCEHGTLEFLTWHRMYLWYFERVLQEAANDPSLRLPFWDYEKDGKLPAAYWDKEYKHPNGLLTPNPLRVEARQPGLNNGTTSLSSGATSTDQAMKATTYVPFNNSLQATPHGTVHCAIVTNGCQNGLMGSVPVAALDPVFYAHHTNIDRLYECWLRVDPSKRLPQGQNDIKYTFVDADGSTQQRRVGDMLTTAQLGYTYAAGAGCPAAAVAVAQAAPSPAPTTEVAEQALATAGPTRLNPTVTTVPLAVSPSAGAALAPQLGAAAPGPTYLVIDGVQYDDTPGGLYDVYLQGAGGQREHVGVINFFNLAPSGSDSQAGHAGHAQTRESFRFDVTDAVKQLNISPGAQPSLVFVPTTGLTSSSPSVAAQEPLAPQMNAQANVRFDSARLVSAP